MCEGGHFLGRDFAYSFHLAGPSPFYLPHGPNPACHLVDKSSFIGTQAHPLMYLFLWLLSTRLRNLADTRYILLIHSLDKYLYTCSPLHCFIISAKPFSPSEILYILVIYWLTIDGQHHEGRDFCLVCAWLCPQCLGQCLACSSMSTELNGHQQLLCAHLPPCPR